MRVALYQPDIPQNLGTILRLGACVAVPIDVVGPTGFPLGERGLKRAGMDYADRVAMTQHESWRAFCDADRVGRLILITTKATALYQEFNFRPDDCLLFGSESSGVPNAVHDVAAHRLCIPMTAGVRSLNVAVAVAMVVGEGLRQTRRLPRTPVPA